MKSIISLGFAIGYADIIQRCHRELQVLSEMQVQSWMQMQSCFYRYSDLHLDY